LTQSSVLAGQEKNFISQQIERLEQSLKQIQVNIVQSKAQLDCVPAAHFATHQR
jgi:uncharacterized protein (UPF0335 family)